MQIVTIIPIIKGLPKESLTYFSTGSVSVGNIVTIDLNHRLVQALVIKAEDARNIKSNLKKSDFSLKKILKIEKGQLAPSLITAAHTTADYYTTSLSKVLGAILPRRVLVAALCEKTKYRKQKTEAFKTKYLEGTHPDRFEWIKKNMLSNSKKVLYVSPSNHELVKAKRFFEDKVIHTAEVRPRHIICASPEYGFIWLPYVDVIILDHASGAGYQDQSSAKIDFKKVYELHARNNNQELIICDTVLDLKYHTQGNLVCSLSKWPNIRLIKKEKKLSADSWLVSNESQALVKKVLSSNERMFFFAPRKSVATMTICSDCGEVVSCKTCGKSLTLSLHDNGRKFICKECKKASSSDVQCEYCESWKLTPLGVTVESVADEIERLFPKACVLRVSSDTTKTKLQLKKVVKQFYATAGVIMVGTELALPYLESEITYSVISSIDAFVNSKNLSARDKAARLIFTIASVEKEGCILETTDVDSTFLQHICSGDIKKYREEELAERKKFNYPPYSKIIKIQNDVFFIKNNEWPQQELVERIRCLHRDSTYTIDADSVV